jgi:hypothetical protein
VHPSVASTTVKPRPSYATTQSPAGSRYPAPTTYKVITSTATVVEVVHPRINRPALEWTLARLVVEPVTVPIARHAATLLADAGLHGHKHAIDRHAQREPSPRYLLRGPGLGAPGLLADARDAAIIADAARTMPHTLRLKATSARQMARSSRRLVSAPAVHGRRRQAHASLRYLYLLRRLGSSAPGARTATSAARARASPAGWACSVAPGAEATGGGEWQRQSIYASAFTAAAKRRGRRAAVGTMRGASAGCCRALTRSSVRSRWWRVARLQSVS